MVTLFDREAAHVSRALGSLVLLMAANSGCFSERSFPLDPADSVRVSQTAPDAGISTRDWLATTHAHLAHLLPEQSPTPLLTRQLGNGDGQAADVFSHFDIRPDNLQSIVRNFRGIRFSAQAASTNYYIDRTPPPWPGFEDIWIPLDMPAGYELSLSARIGYARDDDGNVRDADCIVILPGLFGDNGVKRSADLAVSLRESGFHVLSVELRGHGRTEGRYPNMYHTFGVLEADDLLKVADWLEDRLHVRRTGLIAYCWSANIALLTAWYDAVSRDDPAVSPALRPYMTAPLRETPRFAAGVIAFSPVLRWEVLMDELDQPRSVFAQPIFAAIQDTVRDRMQIKGYPDPSGNLRLLTEREYAGYGVPMPKGAAEGHPFLRLVPYKGHVPEEKLERVRVPVLIVHAADDPLASAQAVADLVATIDNPRVAALILPSGGHVGFAAYANAYYLSLITNFFDPAQGPAGTDYATPPLARRTVPPAVE